MINRQIQYSQQPVTRILIISGVLLLSFVVGLSYPSKYLLLPFLLITAFGAYIVNIRFPPIGLLAIIACGLLINFEIGTNTNTGINIVVILLSMFIGIWLIDMFVRKRSIQLIPSRTYLPLVALALVSILAFGIGQIDWFLYARQAPIFSQLGGLVMILLSIGAFVFSANVIRNITWLKRLSWLFLTVGAIIVIARVFPVLGQRINDSLPNGTSGSMFWIWMTAILFSQFLINRELNRGWRILLLVLILLLVYEALIQGYVWKSGWIPAAAAVGVITWIRFRRLRVLLTLGGIVLIWFIISYAIESDQYSYITRLEAWKIIINEIIKVNPIFGLGPSNYRFYTPLFPIMGYWIEFNSHNNYVDFLAQIGILGLLVFLWFVWEVWKLGWGLLKTVSESFSKAYIHGALGGLIGMLVAGMLGDWIIPFVYNIGLKGFRASVLGWIFLGGLVVIDRVSSTDQLD